jgi:N-acylneuraminate cytidylyltransferase
MINGKRVLGVVTARGGSKGILKKNIRQIGGKPLIAWTIHAAKASTCLDRVILSSDDDAIIEVAKSFGCEVPFKRASQLAQDDTPSIDVILDALDRCDGYEWVILLQPTSPLRTSADIDEAIQKCVALAAPACVSVCKAEQSPFWMFTLQDSRIQPVIDIPLIKRRQEMPIAYVLNGAIYIAKTDWLRQKRTFITENTVAFEMPVDRSLDIDEELDLDIFNSLLIKQRQ